MVLPILLSTIKKTKPNVTILLLLVYLAILVFTYEYPLNSLRTFFGVIIALLMYPVAYKYVSINNGMSKLYPAIIVLLILFSIHFFIAQIFRIGEPPYASALPIYPGWGQVQQTYMISYFLLFLPFLFMIRNKQVGIYEIIIFFISIFPVVLIFRRGALFGLLMGIVAYAIITPKKGKIVKLVIAVGVLLIVTSPIYIERLESVIEYRPSTEIETFESMSRTQEFRWATRLMEREGYRHTLFGSALYDYTTFAGVRRPLHTDYTTYLIGSGIIGFILYFLVIVFIWSDFLRYRKRIKSKYVRKELLGVMVALTILYVLLSYSGQYYVISSLGTIMFLYAVINKYTYEMSYKDTLNKTNYQINNRE